MIYLFDIDGVIIHYQGYFSQTLDTNKYIDPTKAMDEYYKSPINCECDKGVKDIFIEIKPYLNSIRWNGSSEEYFKMQWDYEKNYIEHQILDRINDLKKIGHQVFIASNQNKYRKQFLINEMNLNDIFHSCFFSCDIGYVKNEKKYWDYIEKYFMNNNLPKNEVIFFDDLEENVKMAQDIGINSVQIKDKRQMIDLLENEIRKMA